MTIAVHTHFGGSTCVVQIRSDWELYIDARQDPRHPENSYIEVVRRGHVVDFDICLKRHAPARIIELIKEYQ